MPIVNPVNLNSLQANNDVKLSPGGSLTFKEIMKPISGQTPKYDIETEKIVREQITKKAIYYRPPTPLIIKNRDQPSQNLGKAQNSNEELSIRKDFTSYVDRAKNEISANKSPEKGHNFFSKNRSPIKNANKNLPVDSEKDDLRIDSNFTMNPFSGELDGKLGMIKINKSKFASENDELRGMSNITKSTFASEKDELRGNSNLTANTLTSDRVELRQNSKISANTLTSERDELRQCSKITMNSLNKDKDVVIGEPLPKLPPNEIVSKKRKSMPRKL